jgi:hypothetical protein
MHLIRPTRLGARSFEERGTLPVRLAATLSREFPRGEASASPDDREALDRSLTDLTSLYGAVYRPELVDLDRLASQKFMAAEVLGELGPLLGEVDLVILAYATPDLDTRDFVGCFIADTVPGGPMVFSVSDQGSTAPFTALRLAGDYLADCGGRRALVLTLDQHIVPWDVPNRAAVPTCSAAVAVVVDSAKAEGLGTQVWHYTAVAPQDIDTTVEEAWASARLRLGRSAVLVAGRDTPLPQDVADSATAVVVADRGRVCTGVWHALDDYRLNHSDRPGPIVVLDYDPVWRYLGVAVFDDSIG